MGVQLQRLVSFKIFTRGGDVICMVETKIGRCGSRREWNVRLRRCVKLDCGGFNARRAEFSGLQ